MILLLIMPRMALFFGIFLMGILLVPGVVGEADAAYGEVPNPVTDVSQAIAPGTVIEYDLNWDALCSVHNVCPNGFHELQIYVNKNGSPGNQEFLAFFNQDGTQITGDAGMFQLVRQNGWDYQLYVNTGTANSAGTVLAEGQHRLSVDLKTSPTSTMSGGSDFTLSSSFVDLIDPVITIPELTTDQSGNKNIELSMSGSSFSSHTLVCICN